MNPVTAPGKNEQGGLTMEIWKDVVGFEGLYKVSNQGNIKSLDRQVNVSRGSKRIVKGKQLMPYSTQRKNCLYKGVVLYKDTKKHRKTVHRIVAEAFIPNPHNLPCVNHKDENRFNNAADNLEWCDVKYNNNYGTRLQRIGDKHKKPVVCVTTGRHFESIKQASQIMGIERTEIGNMCNGRKANTKGYKFAFQE